MRLSGPAFSLLYRSFYTRLADLRPRRVVATHSLAATLALRASHNVPGLPLRRRGRRHGLRAARLLAAPRPRPVLRRRPCRDAALATATAKRVRRDHRDPGARAVRVRDRPPAAASAWTCRRRPRRARAGGRDPAGSIRALQGLAVDLAPALADSPNHDRDRDRPRRTLCRELRRRVAGFGATNVRVLGYVEEMASAMAAADMAVVQARRPRDAECSLRAPMVLIGPAAGQGAKPTPKRSRQPCCGLTKETRDASQRWFARRSPAPGSSRACAGPQWPATPTRRAGCRRARAGAERHLT